MHHDLLTGRPPLPSTYVHLYYGELTTKHSYELAHGYIIITCVTETCPSSSGTDSAAITYVHLYVTTRLEHSDLVLSRVPHCVSLSSAPLSSLKGLITIIAESAN